ncbi:MAG: hypothetical protein AAF266_13900 [Planctomycetota bacterium]
MPRQQRTETAQEQTVNGFQQRPNFPLQATSVDIRQQLAAEREQLRQELARERDADRQLLRSAMSMGMDYLTAHAADTHEQLRDLIIETGNDVAALDFYAEFIIEDMD